MDNVVGANKNTDLLRFGQLICRAGIVEKVEFVYLAEYHGKCLIDGCFGVLHSITQAHEIVDKDDFGDFVHADRTHFACRELSYRARHDWSKIMDPSVCKKNPITPYKLALTERGYISITSDCVRAHRSRGDSAPAVADFLGPNAPTSPASFFALVDQHAHRQPLRPYCPQVAALVGHRGEACRDTFMASTLLRAYGQKNEFSALTNPDVVDNMDYGSRRCTLAVFRGWPHYVRDAFVTFERSLTANALKTEHSQKLLHPITTPLEHALASAKANRKRRASVPEPESTSDDYDSEPEATQRSLMQVTNALLQRASAATKRAAGSRNRRLPANLRDDFELSHLPKPESAAAAAASSSSAALSSSSSAASLSSSLSQPSRTAIPPDDTDKEARRRLRKRADCRLPGGFDLSYERGRNPVRTTHEKLDKKLKEQDPNHRKRLAWVSSDDTQRLVALILELGDEADAGDADDESDDVDHDVDDSDPGEADVMQLD